MKNIEIELLITDSFKYFALAIIELADINLYEIYDK